MPTAARPSPLITLARALLGRAKGFRDCAPGVLDALVAVGELRTLEKGEYLTRRGGSFDGLALVLSGALESSFSHRNGHRQLVGYLRSGDIAGFIGLLDDLGHVCDLLACANTQVLMIPKAPLLRLRAKHADIIQAFEVQLASRSRILYERLSADPSLPVEVRLGRLLLSLAGLYGLPREGGVLLDVKLSQTDMADFMGVSRQRVNAAIGQLQALGCIDAAYSRLTITDSGALQAFVAGH